jgi:LPXTG-motif cell wall-anchored protein
MQFARAVRAPLCVVAAVAATGLLVVPASAHTPSLKAVCADGDAVLTVGLSRYDGRRPNAVAVEDNGRSVEDTRFGESFRESYRGSGTVEHVFTVTVRAWDDPYWQRGWSFTKKLTVPVCVTPTTAVTTTTVPVPVTTTTTTTVTTPVETSTTTTTTTTTTSTTTTPLTFDWPTTRPKAVVVAAANSGLPDTGADVTVPLVLGVLLLAGGVVVLVVLRRRLRR